MRVILRLNMYIIFIKDFGNRLDLNYQVVVSLNYDEAFDDQLFMV